MKRIEAIILTVCMILLHMSGCTKASTKTDLTDGNLTSATAEQSYVPTTVIKQTSSQLTDNDVTTEKITEISKQQTTMDEKAETVNNNIEHARLDTIWLDEEFAKAEKVSFSREMNGVLLIHANGKYGLVNINGKTLQPPIYNDIDWFYEDRSIVYMNDKYGCVDTNGKLIIPVIYDGMGRYHEGYVSARMGEKTCFFDLEGKMVIPYNHYDALYGFEDGLCAIEQNEKWGFIDTTGKIVIPIIYDQVCDFCNGLTQVIKEGKRGYINKTGQVVIPIIYDNNKRYDIYHGQYVEVSLKGKYGIVDGTGKVIVPLDYDWLYNCGSGLEIAEKDGKQGVIDITGKIIIPLIYDKVEYSWKEDLFHITLDHQWGKIDKTGKIVLPIESKKPYAADLYADRKDDKIGFSDINGKVIIPCIYDFWEESIQYVDGYFKLFKDNKTGVISETGEIVLPFEYDYIRILSEGCAFVSKDKKTGLFNLKTRELKIPLVDVNNFFSGQSMYLTWFLRDEKWCVIDKNGEILVPSDNFDEINEFMDNCAVVRKDGRWGIARYVSGDDTLE